MSESLISIPRSGRICILLPILNEATNIEPLLRGIDAALAGRDYVVCILDDGSRDGTLEIIARLMMEPGHRLHLIRQQKKRMGCQRGGALWTSLGWALSDPRVQVIIEMDGDRSHRPEELPTGLDTLEREGLDVVIASKYLRGSRVTGRPWGRRAVSVICNFAVRLLMSRRVTDYSNGYRFYRRAAGEAIAATANKYTSPIYLTEVMAIWLDRGLRIGEFPSHYVGRNEGLSKLRWTDLVKASLAIFEIASRLHFCGFAAAKGSDGRSLAPPHEAVRKNL